MTRDKFYIIYSSVKDNPPGSNFVQDLQKIASGDFGLKTKGWSLHRSIYSNMVRYYDSSGSSVSLMPLYDEFFGMSKVGIIVMLGSQTAPSLENLARNLNLPYNKKRK